MTLKTTPQTISSSRATMTELVLPPHANAMGNVFGGQILAWMDICAAICAQRHCGVVAVTAGVDELSFERPIKVGQIVRLEARMTAAFKSSFEVKVSVHGEDPLADEIWPCVTAFLTFVAVGADGRPVTVPPLVCDTDEDRALERDGHERRRFRLERRKK